MNDLGMTADISDIPDIPHVCAVGGRLYKISKVRDSVKVLICSFLVYITDEFICIQSWSSPNLL